MKNKNKDTKGENKEYFTQWICTYYYWKTSPDICIIKNCLNLSTYLEQPFTLKDRSKICSD